MLQTVITFMGNCYPTLIFIIRERELSSWIYRSYFFLIFPYLSLLISPGKMDIRFPYSPAEIIKCNWFGSEFPVLMKFDQCEMFKCSLVRPQREGNRSPMDFLVASSMASVNLNERQLMANTDDPGVTLLYLRWSILSSIDTTPDHPFGIFLQNQIHF